MMMRWLTIALIFALFASGAAWAEAANEAGPDKAVSSGASGQPLPRFASLRANEVNLRTGPGKRYPIDWVIKRQGMPVEITAEYDMWRRVRDHDGTEGWVHKATLSGKRMVLTIGAVHDLHRHDEDQSPVLARLEAGVVGQLLSCGPEWCQLKFNDIKGYLRKNAVWGVYPHEVF